MSFAIGDLVRLKSGGPDMTVTRESHEGYVQTTWFAGKKSERAAFPEPALDRVVPTSEVK